MTPKQRAASAIRPRDGHVSSSRQSGRENNPAARLGGGSVHSKALEEALTERQTEPKTEPKTEGAVQRQLGQLFRNPQ